MRIGYLIDSNLVRADRRPLTPAELADGLDAMVEEGVLAERAGFHSVHAPDRHAAPACAFPGPEQLLTLLAHETERVMLATFTFVATLVHPLKAAEQFAVVDNLSRGRLVTTVSRGFLPSFWGQFGIPEEKLLGRFLEALRIWRAAFGGERFDFAGAHWTVRDGYLAPAPFQPGGWPLWSGGNASPAAIRRSADIGEAWTCDPMPHAPEAFAADLQTYRERAEALGKRPFVALMRDGWVADSFADAAHVFGEHYARMTRFYLRHGNLTRNPGFASPEEITPESVAPYIVMGEPQRCVEQLERLHEEDGVDYVVFCCRLSTGPSLAETREQILRFGEEVVRPIHARYPAPDHPAIPAACRW
jgi:alkanesulfonate monooxygenase SsuD/methylene tetrahydromethanopterin reductase-like flavin-dependent oxidoreductase (luciferase family)